MERDPLTALADLLAAVEKLEERVVELERERVDAIGQSTWLTLPQAARELGCTPDAVRMRCKRGRLEHRHHGRRLYVARRSIEELS